MTFCAIQDVGAIWSGQMLTRIGSVAAAVVGTHNGDDVMTSGGAYCGAVNQVYTVTITKAGIAGVAEITVTGSNGDNSGPTIITGEDTPIEIGNLGATVEINFGDDETISEVAVGDTVTIACLGVGEIKYCAVGSGDWSAVPPGTLPNAPTGEAALKSEFARKHYTRKAFLVEDETGPIRFGGLRFSETATPTRRQAYFFEFSRAEANEAVIREYAFFAGGSLRVEGDYGTGGLYDVDTNPDGQVVELGTMYGLTYIEDYTKTTQIELPITFIMVQ